MNRTALAALSLVLLSASACTDSAPESSESTEAQAIIEGSPEAVGLLDLLNDAETTFTVLDVDVPLDKRAAENLIAHRDGADGILGTADDDLFDTVEEVDAVKYVGAKAMEKLLAYAVTEGYVPEGEDVLGVYDGVAYTVNEAEVTLAFANTATVTELDVDADLDIRAVDSIIEARQIMSMPELAGLYFVGKSALLKLREYPKTLAGSKGIWEDCGAHAECASGLCAGLIVFQGNGWCFEASQANTFSSTSATAIPDNNTLVTNSIPVSGLATVPLDVIVTLDIDHPRKQDLFVALHQPGGAYAVLWDHEANPASVIEQPNGLEGDNMVNGTWTLDVIDTVTGESGTVNSWSMWISSNYD